MAVSTTMSRRVLNTESLYSREEVIAAIQDLYELLVALPYVEPSALVLPPKDGWSGVNAEELDRRGKTKEVVELLRHLPYLRRPTVGKRWMIGPDTVVIAYCDGELYDKLVESIQPVPGHCIWLTDCQSRDGTGLLLDTQTGTITEWTPMEHKIMMDHEEYEALPRQNKWMAHATMPVTFFFRLWKQRFERLVWMALYDPRGAAGTAQWYISAVTRQDEEDMLASDDEFEPSDCESEETENGEDDLGDEGRLIPSEEVDGLMEDSYGEKAHEIKMSHQAQHQTADHTQLDLQPPGLLDRHQSGMMNLDQKTREVYDIYKRNGWPSSFDRKSCEMELAEFLEHQE